MVRNLNEVTTAATFLGVRKWDSQARSVSLTVNLWDVPFSGGPYCKHKSDVCRLENLGASITVFFVLCCFFKWPYLALCPTLNLKPYSKTQNLDSSYRLGNCKPQRHCCLSASRFSSTNFFWMEKTFNPRRPTLDPKP